MTIHEPESVVEHDRDEARTLRDLEDHGALSHEEPEPYEYADLEVER